MGRRSARSEEGAFVVEGAVVLAEAVGAGWAVEAVFAAPGAPVVDTAGAPRHELAPGVLERVASTEAPQPLLAIVRWPAPSVAAITAAAASFVVVGVGLADPGNLGTIVRCADAAGADAVVLTAGSVDPTNPKVVRATAGSLFHLPVVSGVAVDDLAALGLPLVGTTATGGAPYDEADALAGPVALVLGNEAHGLPPGLALDDLVTIPHAGRAESLNVAMAAAVLCFEIARRRRHSR